MLYICYCMPTASRIDTGIPHKRKFVMTPEIFEEMSRYYDKLKQVGYNNDFVFEVNLEF